jgi:coenzyme F420-reducing hydrogenase beta subunit
MNRMVYGVCTKCSHTRDFTALEYTRYQHVYERCYSCGCERWFRVVRQIELPDGSVVEVIE